MTVHSMKTTKRKTLLNKEASCVIDGLRKYFPMIRTEKEILAEIQGKNALNTIFQKWTTKQQRDFLNMATGMRGVKVLYDSYFKEIFNPELRPKRLEAFLSLLLKQRIKIKAILHGDSSRIADERLQFSRG